MISVICPIYNEEKYIDKCIGSIMEQDYPKDDMEVLFVDGMSTDGTRGIIAGYAEKMPYIRLIDNPRKTVPFAMNAGIDAASGDIIIRLDAHAEYGHDYFSMMVKYLDELPDAENVGGVCVTLPCNGTDTAAAIAVALSHTFGMGNSYFRTGTDSIREVDTVPFGCFRKEMFEKTGLYDTELTRNQDDELNGRIIKNGGKIYLIPSVRIKYFARDKIGKVRRMFWQYGMFKPLVNKKLGAPATLRQFVPPLFAIFAACGVVAWLYTPATIVWSAVMLLYAATAIYIGIKEAVRQRRKALAWLLPYVFANIHLAYGAGYIAGIYKVIFKKSFNVKSNR